MYLQQILLKKKHTIIIIIKLLQELLSDKNLEKGQKSARSSDKKSSALSDSKLNLPDSKHQQVVLGRFKALLK